MTATNTLTPYLSDLKLGDVQTSHNMSVVPLFVENEDGPHYITMDEALERGFVRITEKSAEGSVPELVVENIGVVPVLFIDGAEVAGAKQDRVINTTILIREKSTTTIPVSCTESGRWSYRTPEFSDSENVLYSLGRAVKTEDVSASLKAKAGYSSKQGRVWAGIEELMADVGTSSKSNAMRDAYRARRVDMSKYKASVPLLPHQNGLLVFVNGKPIGYDVVSRAEAYARLHDRLVASYSMDALRKRGGTPSAVSVDDGRKFLFEASEAAEEKHESVGYGRDHRFTGERVVGSALVHQNTVIHSAFFRRRRETAGEGQRSARERLALYLRHRYGRDESPPGPPPA